MSSTAENRPLPHPHQKNPKNYPIQNVISAKIEKPCPKLKWMTNFIHMGESAGQERKKSIVVCNPKLKSQLDVQ